MSLALLQVDQIVSFCNTKLHPSTILDDYQENKNSSPFYHYSKKNWFNLVGVNRFSVFGAKHRTICAVENYNYPKNRFRVLHPNFWTLTKRLICIIQAKNSEIQQQKEALQFEDPINNNTWLLKGELVQVN